MIEAKGLNVGNIYNRKHGKGHTETIFDEEIISAIFNDTSSEYALNDFDTIPLTEQHILGFGYEAIQELATDLIEKSKVPLIDNVALLVDHLQTLPVHKLQNLYYELTGEELKKSE